MSKGYAMIVDGLKMMAAGYELLTNTEGLAPSPVEKSLTEPVKETPKKAEKAKEETPAEKKVDVNVVPIQDSIGRMQNTPIINESDLHSLILGSKLPSAKKFKRWVTSEVLPTNRRHGVYEVDEVLANLDMLIEALLQLKKERKTNQELKQTVAAQKQQIVEMKPKASYYDVVLNCKELVAISVIAKDYGWSANRMNKYLHEKGVQYKQGNKIWLLYQKYAEMGYTSTKTHSYPRNDGTMHTAIHTYWTQQGRLFIYELLKSDGILPTMEQEDGYVD